MKYHLRKGKIRMHEGRVVFYYAYRVADWTKDPIYTASCNSNSALSGAAASSIRIKEFSIIAKNFPDRVCKKCLSALKQHNKTKARLKSIQNEKDPSSCN